MSRSTVWSADTVFHILATERGETTLLKKAHQRKIEHVSIKLIVDPTDSTKEGNLARIISFYLVQQYCTQYGIEFCNEEGLLSQLDQRRVFRLQCSLADAQLIRTAIEEARHGWKCILQSAV
ncbi:hypothetical protein COU75_01790 [Candidatus Peregrinibacteria bacterium CG10_big_fil_rev_8_21_14_0_10_42_8]|nr:MAG: hypothetical protein COU75_01790 [Candidatus Peregrinibacteria bacterium CG10_big_fil_rev_8_21_14_0_10_42_8]